MVCLDFGCCLGMTPRGIFLSSDHTDEGMIDQLAVVGIFVKKDAYLPTAIDTFPRSTNDLLASEHIPV